MVSNGILAGRLQVTVRYLEGTRDDDRTRIAEAIRGMESIIRDLREKLDPPMWENPR